MKTGDKDDQHWQTWLSQGPSKTAEIVEQHLLRLRHPEESRVSVACQSMVGKFRLGYPTVLEGGREGIMEVPSIKLDILVGLESILGKFILVDLLGTSLPGFLISSEEGFGSFLSLLTLAEGLSRPARTRWEPPGGGLGSSRPVPVPAKYRPALSGTLWSLSDWTGVRRV